MTEISQEAVREIMARRGTHAYPLRYREQQKAAIEADLQAAYPAIQAQVLAEVKERLEEEFPESRVTIGVSELRNFLATLNPRAGISIAVLTKEECAALCYAAAERPRKSDAAALDSAVEKLLGPATLDRELLDQEGKG